MTRTTNDVGGPDAPGGDGGSIPGRDEAQRAGEGLKNAAEAAADGLATALENAGSALRSAAERAVSGLGDLLPMAIDVLTATM